VARKGRTGSIPVSCTSAPVFSATRVIFKGGSGPNEEMVDKDRLIAEDRLA
jgi:hypothetical protein